MINWIYALILSVQKKWSRPKRRYIEATVSFFEFMTKSEDRLKAELQINGFDLDRPIEKKMASNRAAYIYRQEIIK